MTDFSDEFKDALDKEIEDQIDRGIKEEMDNMEMSFSSATEGTLRLVLISLESENLKYFDLEQMLEKEILDSGNIEFIRTRLLSMADSLKEHMGT